MSQSTALNVNNRALKPSAKTAKDDAEIQNKDDLNATTTSKPSGKHGKKGLQWSDLPKEEYIRVRARRGQATNSHSLAERVRILVEVHHKLQKRGTIFLFFLYFSSLVLNQVIYLHCS